MFLFCCFTGLSYADLAKLSYDELQQTPDGAWWISSIRQKTKVPFTVKLLSDATFLIADGNTCRCVFHNVYIKGKKLASDGSS